MRGGGAGGVGGLDRVARAEDRDQGDGGRLLGLTLRRGAVGVSALGGENGGEGLVCRGGVEGEVGDGGLVDREVGVMAAGSGLVVGAVPDYTQG